MCLKKIELSPHRSKYWMRPRIDDLEEFELRVELICTLYMMAAKLRDMGIIVVSIDEKTGMQALERKHPTMPAAPGRTRCEEFEYIRHGTTCLTATLKVADGTVFPPTMAQTRDAVDFMGSVKRIVYTDPEKCWIFILDNLNTHMSEEMVRFVAAELELDIDLGVKEKHGILKDMQSRKAFLEDPGHRIMFVFTPRHCSWLNQIEVWFSKLSRRILTHGSHTSVEELEADVLNFITVHNKTAKPHKWNCKAKEVVAKVVAALSSTVI